MTAASSRDVALSEIAKLKGPHVADIEWPMGTVLDIDLGRVVIDILTGALRPTAIPTVCITPEWYASALEAFSTDDPSYPLVLVVFDSGVCESLCGDIRVVLAYEAGVTHIAANYLHYRQLAEYVMPKAAEATPEPPNTPESEPPDAAPTDDLKPQSPFAQLAATVKPRGRGKP